MKLKSFKIGPYRNIINGGTVGADAQVTVLVGKNESGKTNLLHALHALNPANGNRLLRRLDYPRWLQKRAERDGTYVDARPVQVSFSLDEEDSSAVASVFGEEVLLDNEFCIYRHYEEAEFTYIEPSCDIARALEFVTAVKANSTELDLKGLREKLTGESDSTDEDGEPTPAALNAKHALEKLSATYGDAECVVHAIGQFLRPRVPKFFYFDDYAQLPGTIDIEPLLNALTEDKAGGLESNQRTVLALLQLGYADEELIADDYEIRKAELEAVGAQLTQDVLQYWRQNQYLRLMIDINPVVDVVQNGQQIVRRELKLDVMDTRHHFTNSLDARSTGFRWFVSFVAAFGEFEEDENVIVLLDEPGLGLHARAQEDFLRFINDRLATHHQVLFTTHSPFMIDPAHLERVRVVEDQGPTSGTRISAPVTSRDPDTLFPLQAALGYDIAQNLFVGPDNLVVEGLSDFTYLLVMSDHLKSLGRTGLDMRWRILPAGGATNIPTFVALIGPSLDITVLVDGSEDRNQKIRNLITLGSLDDQRLITPAIASAVKNADIEDLFSVEDYLRLYNGAFSSTIDEMTLGGEDRIIKRLERAVESFDHNRPSNFLLYNRDTVAGDFNSSSCDRFEFLFEAINNTLA